MPGNSHYETVREGQNREDMVLGRGGMYADERKGCTFVTSRVSCITCSGVTTESRHPCGRSILYAQGRMIFALAQLPSQLCIAVLLSLLGVGVCSVNVLCGLVFSLFVNMLYLQQVAYGIIESHLLVKFTETGISRCVYVCVAHCTLPAGWHKS